MNRTLSTRAYLISGLVAGSLAMAGCGHVSPGGSALGGSRATETTGNHRNGAALLVTPRILTGGLKTQAIVAPLTAVADVDHVAITALDANGGVQASATVPQAEIGQVVTLTNLASDTTYTLQCQAFAASGRLVSVDSQSQSILAVANNDVLAPITLAVQLQNVVFDGTATGAVAVTDGVVLPPDQPVAITILTP